MSTILITTSVLDVGVSIHDFDVQNVVLDTFERNTFLQMLGRIRNDGQTINLYIFSRNFDYFSNWIDRKISPHLKVIEELLQVREEYFLMKVMEMKENPEIINQKLKLPIYTDVTGCHLNKLAVYQWNYLFRELNEVKEGLMNDPEFFIKKQLEWIGQEEKFALDNYVSDEVKEIKKENLMQIILKKGKSALERKLSKGEISNFLSSIKTELRDLDRSRIRSNEVVSEKRFNEICKLENLPIRVNKTFDLTERKEKYWLEILKSEDQTISA